MSVHKAGGVWIISAPPTASSEGVWSGVAPSVAASEGVWSTAASPVAASEGVWSAVSSPVGVSEVWSWLNSTTVVSDLAWSGVHAATGDAEVGFPASVSGMFPSGAVIPTPDPRLAGWVTFLVINLELEGPSLSSTSGTTGGRCLSAGILPHPASDPCPLPSPPVTAPHCPRVLTHDPQAAPVSAMDMGGLSDGGQGP